MNSEVHQVQFKVGKNDKMVYDLINKLKSNGRDQRGYVSDQIRKRLQVYEVLSQMTGEDEPMSLLAKVSSSIMSDTQNFDNTEVKSSNISPNANKMQSFVENNNL